MEMKYTTLDKLVKDWKIRFDNAETDKERMRYVEKFRELLEWSHNPNFEVKPYIKEDGSYDYTLRTKR